VLGDHDEARRVLKLALREASSARDRVGYARVLLEVGRRLTDLDELERAARLLARALRLAEAEQAQLEIGRACLYAARASRELADFKRAAHLAERSIAIARDLRETGLEARATFLLGDVTLRRKRYRQARAVLERARDLAELAGDRTILVHVLADLSVVLQAPRYQQRDFAQAIRYAKEAVRHASELELVREHLYAENALALAYLAAGKPSWAKTITSKALRIARGEAMMSKRLAELLFIHYRVLKALKHPGAAKRLEEVAALVSARVARQRRPERRERMARKDPFNAQVLAEGKRLASSQAPP
jgi:tetratricopeptide (TPR) repeat protein